VERFADQEQLKVVVVVAEIVVLDGRNVQGVGVKYVEVPFCRSSKLDELSNNV
jgi:hypothetical protein